MIEKIFKAYDVRAIYPSPLNEDAAWKVGHATAQFLKRSRQGATEKVKLENTLVVGRDMRPSSPALAKALIDGISSVGMDVIDGQNHPFFEFVLPIETAVITLELIPLENLHRFFPTQVW